MDPDILEEVLRPPSAARAGAVLRRRPLAVLGAGQAGQGAARAADSAQAEAQAPAAADLVVAAADPVVAAAAPAGEADPEVGAPAALGAVAGPAAVPGKQTY